MPDSGWGALFRNRVSAAHAGVLAQRILARRLRLVSGLLFVREIVDRAVLSLEATLTGQPARHAAQFSSRRARQG
jgi:hypothetical protein